MGSYKNGCSYCKTLESYMIHLHLLNSYNERNSYQSEFILQIEFTSDSYNIAVCRHGGHDSFYCQIHTFTEDSQFITAFIVIHTVKDIHSIEKIRTKSHIYTKPDLKFTYMGMNSCRYNKIHILLSYEFGVSHMNTKNYS